VMTIDVSLAIVRGDGSQAWVDIGYCILTSTAINLRSLLSLAGPSE
jgi:hypothetical protein